jgi:hypothetical protein
MKFIKLYMLAVLSYVDEYEFLHFISTEKAQHFPNVISGCPRIHLFKFL